MKKRRNNLWLNVFDLLRRLAVFPQYRAAGGDHSRYHADERGNLTYEHEGAYLGPLDRLLPFAIMVAS